MGISIEAWRASIGQFNGLHVRGMGDTSEELWNGGFRMRLLQIILILLIIGGIERNPGPNHLQCKSCKLNVLTVKGFVQHQRTHSLDTKFRFACGYVRCVERFNNLISFKNHMNRFHGTQKTVRSASNFHLLRNSTATEFTCKHDCCHQKALTMDELLRHTREHIDKGDAMVCPFLDCQNIFTKKTTLSCHVSRYHKNKTIHTPLVATTSAMESETDEISAIGSSCNSYNDDNPSNDEEHVNMSEGQDDLEIMILKFYLKMQSRYILPASTIQSIVEDLACITESAHDHSTKQIKSEMENQGIPADKIKSVIDAYEAADVLFRIHKKNGCNNFSIHSDSSRKSAYKKYFEYLDPVNIYLGVPKGSKRRRHAHYIPITETLTRLLRDKHVQTQIDNPKQTDGNILVDFRDGSVFKNHKVFSNAPTSIQLFLYQDSFEVVNPLGSAKSKHKVLGVYFTIGNLMPHHRSNVDKLQLAMLVREKDFKEFGQEKTFRKLIADLKDLEKNGVPYKDARVPVVVASILGDNLGSHCIGGYVENFSGEYYCRFCPMRKHEFLVNPHSKMSLRTQENYNQSVQLVHDNSDTINSHEGVKFDSLFNSLDNFHVTQPGLSPCLGHDLLEGVIDYDLAMMIKYFVKKKKWVTYSVLNQRIAAWKYLGSDSTNKPAAINIKGIRLGGHACQNWCLLRLLPFFLNEFVLDKTDSVWRMYLQLKEVTEMICAPSISEEQLCFMRILIDEYIESRQQLFPTKPLIPKHHFITHYPDLTRLLGPLIRQWTLRFESKHSYYKRCARVCNNFINITKTLTLRNQLLVSYLNTGSVYSDEISFEGSMPFNLQQCEGAIQTILCKEIIEEQSVQVHKAVFRGVTYRSGLYLLLSLNGYRQALTAGKIIFIIISPSFNVKFVVQKCRADFVTDLGLYVLTEEVPTSYFCISLSDIDCNYYPLPSYQMLGEKYLSFKHSSPSLFM